MEFQAAIYTVRAKKNAIKESAVSLIKKFVIHLWNPEMGYLNKQLGIGIIAFFSLQLTMHTSALWTVL
jgi:hypothetical protein